MEKVKIIENTITGFAGFIDQTYSALKKQSHDLSPANPQVNNLLDAMYCVTKTASAHSDAAQHWNQLSKEINPESWYGLRDLMNVSEGIMENFYTKSFCKEPDFSRDNLKEFKYYDNYVTLVDYEMNLLKKSELLGTENKAVFIGSGPMPLTMLFWQENCGFHATGVDYDEEACLAGKELFNMLRNRNSDFIVSAGEEFDYTDTGIIFIASLAENKNEIINKAKHDRGNKKTDIFVRTAEDFAQLYYKPFWPDDSLALAHHGKTKRTPECVNTTLHFSFGRD